MIRFLLFTKRKIQMSEFSFEIKTSFVAEGLAFIHLSFMNITTVYITNLIQSDYSVEQPSCLSVQQYIFLEFLGSASSKRLSLSTKKLIASKNGHSTNMLLKTANDHLDL